MLIWVAIDPCDTVCAMLEDGTIQFISSGKWSKSTEICCNATIFHCSVFQHGAILQGSIEGLCGSHAGMAVTACTIPFLQWFLGLPQLFWIEHHNCFMKRFTADFNSRQNSESFKQLEIFSHQDSFHVYIILLSQWDGILVSPDSHKWVQNK